MVLCTILVVRLILSPSAPLCMNHRKFFRYAPRPFDFRFRFRRGLAMGSVSVRRRRSPLSLPPAPRWPWPIGMSAMTARMALRRGSFDMATIPRRAAQVPGGKPFKSSRSRPPVGMDDESQAMSSGHLPQAISSGHLLLALS